jgi:hypothetical protein
MKIAAALVICASLAFTDASAAAERGRPEAGRLIGTTVLAADGAEIGVVEDVRVDEQGVPSSIRVKAGARLGFGVRSVHLPKNAFTIVRGQVVVDLPRETVEMLPSIDVSADE